MKIKNTDNKNANNTNNRSFITKIKKNIVIILSILAFSACLAGCSGEADSKYEAGLEQIEKGDYAGACKNFEESININSEKAEYYIGYGAALICMGDYEGAREQYQKVVTDTDNRIVRENNKRAYRGIALTYYNEGNYEQAKGYFELALKTKELENIDKDIMAYLADCELYLNNIDKSLSYLNKLIEEGGSGAAMSGYYLGRAKAHSILGNHSEAIADYQNAIKEKSGSYDAYMGLYFELKGTLDESGAAKVLEEAEAVAEKDDEDVFYYAVFKYFEGDYDKAAESFDKALEQGNDDAIFYKGRISQDNGDYEGAIALYSEYLIKKPGGKTAEYCNQLAGCLIELERYDEALDWLDQGIPMAAGEIKNKLVFNKIIVNEHLGKYEEAKNIAAEYLKENPDDTLQREYEFIKTRARN